MYIDLPPLPQPYDAISSRLAHEGVPVRAIARGLGKSSEDVRLTLQYHISIGTITEMPKEDWPPLALRSDRLPTALRSENESTVILRLQHLFKLTPLEANFMMVFLKRDEVYKETLHHVIETQRATRKSRPDTTETTNIKMVDVIICKLRTKFKHHAITIHTLWGAGYYIDDDSRTVLEQFLGPGATTRDSATAASLSSPG
jgi:hypothetical protein